MQRVSNARIKGLFRSDLCSFLSAAVRDDVIQSRQLQNELFAHEAPVAMQRT